MVRVSRGFGKYGVETLTSAFLLVVLQLSHFGQVIPIILVMYASLTPRAPSNGRVCV